jgi:hypothetical protein
VIQKEDQMHLAWNTDLIQQYRTWDIHTMVLHLGMSRSYAMKFPDGTRTVIFANQLDRVARSLECTLAPPPPSPEVRSGIAMPGSPPALLTWSDGVLTGQLEDIYHVMNAAYGVVVPKVDLYTIMKSTRIFDQYAGRMGLRQQVRLETVGVLAQIFGCAVGLGPPGTSESAPSLFVWRDSPDDPPIPSFHTLAQRRLAIPPRRHDWNRVETPEQRVRDRRTREGRTYGMNPDPDPDPDPDKEALYAEDPPGKIRQPAGALSGNGL